MTNHAESTPLEQATLKELTDLIAELEQYRERLVNDALAVAQRAKIMKPQALASLEPSLKQIDAQLQVLRQQQTKLTESDR